MCTDTSEYWNDVKRNYPYTGPDYYHIPGFDCGHRHLFEASHIGDVNCKDCLRLLKEGNSHNLKEGNYESKSAKKRRLKQERYIKEHEELYGRCSCGNLFTLRTNNITKEKFLGCSNYPTCKNTKNF